MTGKYQGSHKWRPGWGDFRDVQRWISEELAVGGSLLNVPCGESSIGDVRADIDGEREPDVFVDLYNLPFKPKSFDTVYFDPPFAFMWEPGWQALLEDVWAVARERLVVKTPRRRITGLEGSEKTWYVAEPKPGSPQFQVWLFQVFDRVQSELPV